MQPIPPSVVRQKVKVQGHGMTECIPDFHVSAISPVSVDGFSPNFCRWCILGQRWPDYVFGSKGQSSRSRHRVGGAQHSTLPSSATFSSLWWTFPLSVWKSGMIWHDLAWSVFLWCWTGRAVLSESTWHLRDKTRCWRSKCWKNKKQPSKSLALPWAVAAPKIK